MDYDRAAERFLAQYSLKSASIRLLGHSDKRVYKVVDEAGKCFVLGIYWPSGGEAYMRENADYYRRAGIESEMRLLKALDAGAGLHTAVPVLAASGSFAQELDIDGKPLCATLLTYVDGHPMDAGDASFPAQCHEAGAVAARLHNFADGAGEELLAGRPALNRDYVRKCTGLIERGVFAGTIPRADFEALREAEAILLGTMEELDASPCRASGIIHTDLRAANFLIGEGGAVIPVDFGRYAHGCYLYDLGEMCAHMGGEEIQRQILNGYRSVRPLHSRDIKHIEAFFMMFLYGVLAEFATRADMQWLPDTIRDMTERYIPLYEADGFLSKTDI